MVYIINLEQDKEKYFKKIYNNYFLILIMNSLILSKLYKDFQLINKKNILNYGIIDH